ncbi:MAG: 16S rRNA (guanine(527)-N(7))-methyltransferase RsmG, partial [Deltaproteobacteria bacterium]|nr:16S rRNA (guanine(527)-N(7))-methyltransferase RsmG [Deltaproteobacteria bacterium]
MTPGNVSRETKKNWETMPLDRLLTESARKLGLDLQPEQVSILLKYLSELMRWNKKINLIGSSTPADAVVRHLADSLAALPYLPAHPLKVLDIGSGGGLPGLIFKVIRPNWSVTLAESNRKKVSFLRDMTRKFNLKDVQVLSARLKQKTETVPLRDFDLVTARALAPLKNLLPLARPYLSAGGMILAYKGPRARQEIRDAAGALSSQGLSLTRQEQFKLPFLNH